METFDSEALAETLNRVRESLSSFGDALDRSTDPVLDAAAGRRRAEDEDKKRRQEIIDKNKKLANAITNVTSGMISYASQLTNNAGSFSNLNAVVDLASKGISSLAERLPFIGGLLSATTKTLGEASKMMISEFEKGYRVFEQLSETGLVNRFEDLTNSMKYTGLNFEDTQRVLGKFGKELALISSTTVGGRTFFEKLAYESRYLRENFQKIGYSAGEFNEMQMVYISQLQAQGNLRGKSEAELRKGTREYLLELEGLARLTGISRKDAQKQQDDRLRDARFRASIQGLDDKRVQELQNFITAMGPMGEGVKDLTSGFVRTAEAQKVIQTFGLGGVDILSLLDNLKKGNSTAIDAFNQTQQASELIFQRTKVLAKAMGTETNVTAFFTYIDDLRKKGVLSATSFDKLITSISDTTKETDTQNANLAKTKTNFYNLGTEISLLATSSELATKAMSSFSTFMYDVIGKIGETLGITLPEIMVLRKKEVEAIKEETDRREKLKTLEDQLKEKKPSDEVLSAMKKREEYERQIVFQEEMISELKEQLKTETDNNKQQELKKEIADAKKKQHDLAIDMASDKTLLKGPGQEYLTLHNQVTAARKKLDEAGATVATATANRRTYEDKEAAKSGTSVPSPSSVSPKEGSRSIKKLSIDDLLTFSGGKTGTRGHFDKMREVNPAVADKFLEMAAEYNKLTGKKIQVNSSYRSQEEQNALDPGGNPKARISKHTDGRAIDIQPHQVQFLKDKELLKKYGFKDLAGDPPHIYMKNGGIVNATTGGTKVIAGEAGMNEAFVPLPDGQSIPVTIKNVSSISSPSKLAEFEDQTITTINTIRTGYTQIQEVTTRNNDVFNKINDGLSTMNSRLSDILFTLNATKRIQNNILTYSSN